MNKIVYVILILVLSHSTIYGQDQPSNEKIRKNAFYIELFGSSASIFSMNYDRIIKQFKNGYFNASIGFTPVSYLEKGHNIPLSLNYTIGKGNKHFEMGVGLGLNRAFDEEKDIDYQRILGNIRLGYKYQPRGTDYI